MFAEEQVSEVKLGWSSIPPEPATGNTGEIDDEGEQKDFALELTGGAGKFDSGTPERSPNLKRPPHTRRES